MERKKILVVDDEMHTRFLLSEELSSECDISCCANGTDALKEFNRDQPDLVITDFKMPEMNGDELVQKIKGINSQTPIIVLTGITPLPKSQANTTLGKSMFMESLFTSINRFIGTSFSPAPL